jgi:phosphopantetheine--protein transferase-like protein
MSSNPQKGRRNKELFSAEWRRILSLMTGRSLCDNDIALEEKGRPYFPDGKEDFNISHSGALTAVSLVSGEKLRVGCDVESVKPRARAIKIAEKVFTAQEKDYVISSSQKQNGQAAFFEVWTLKECYLKLKGLTVFDMKKTPSFVSEKDGGFHFALSTAASAATNAGTDTPLTFYLYELKGASGEWYILAAAIEGTEQRRPEISWFSQSTLHARSIAEIKAAISPAETVSPNS